MFRIWSVDSFGSLVRIGSPKCRIVFRKYLARCGSQNNKCSSIYRFFSTGGEEDKKGNENSSQKASSKSWIDESRCIPDGLRPYLHLARADKQIGTALLFWPGLWSILLASDPSNITCEPVIASTFLVGSIIMRSAGCTINDLWDRKYDRHVERTKNRPLASGVLSVRQGVAFLTVQLTAGLSVLLTLNPTSILLGAASLPLVVVYPLMKRYTHFPQVVLGMTFNWGALLGYTAVNGSISLPVVLPLYFAGVCWTLVYDTLYGYQDRVDDAKLGLKSTALYLGDSPQWPLTIVSMGMASGLVATGLAADLSAPFYLGTALVQSHCLWQIWSANIGDTENLWQRFSSNKYVGLVIAGSILAGKVF